MHDDSDEGEPMKPWALWRMVNGKQVKRIALADTREELDDLKRRLDWHYKIYHLRKPVD